MTERELLLRTKLLPPRLSSTLLSRSRLRDRLRANLEYPVTLVTANAGSGKTTLIADFVRQQNQTYVWYQLDHTDVDPAVFMGYLIHGLAGHLPDFGRALLSDLKQSPAFHAQQHERAVDMLINEVLERAEEQIIVVLDDYHHLNAGASVHVLVDRLLAYLPEMLHLIIISRELPPLALSRMHAQGRLGMIGRDDLLFTDEETEELFRLNFDLELSAEQLSEYRSRTQGWITALQLIRQMAQRRPHLRVNEGKPDLSEILRQSEADIFDYFAEEVYGGEEKKIQSLLTRVSLLDRIDLETCRRLFPKVDCESALPALVRRNIFITEVSDDQGDEYRFHPLFQSFLRRRLRTELGRAGEIGEHIRIAEFFLAHEQWESAIRHLLAAEKFDEAAAIFAERGTVWIAGGAYVQVACIAGAISEAACEKHPWTLVHHAEVLRLRGDFESARTLLRRAVSLFDHRQDREGAAEALHSLATIARRENQLTAAFAYLQQALDLSGERSAVRIKCGNTRGLCLQALGQYSEAEYEFRIALQAAEERQDEHNARLIAHNLGLPAMMRGDFGEALRWLRRMFRDSAGVPPLPQEATAHLNMARCHFYRGDLSACEKHLEQALDRCQVFNLPGVRAEIFEAYGNLHRERGEASRAAECYERAARTYEEAGIELVRREMLEEQALLRLQIGDVVGARALIDRLIEARVANEDEMGLHTATLARGRILLADREHDAAGAELEPALYYFRERGLNYYEAQASLLLAACDCVSGRETAMLKHLRRAIELAARYDYEYWLQREAFARPHLFAAPAATDIVPPEIRQQAVSQVAAVVDATTAAAIVESPLADLSINLLGPVEIFRNPQRPFSADAWTTRRSRDILCFIASRRHRRVSKDAIIDAFWRDSDFETVARNFHPTISHIRKALNSNQALKLNFLLHRDGDYLLSPEFSIRIDLEEFDRLMSESESARRAGDHDRRIALCEEAIELYRGDFMQGCYEGWVEEQRAFYREQFLHMLEVLVAYAQRTEQWLKSLQLAQQILQADPFREDIYCRIMAAHGALGNRAAVKEQYEMLRRVLRDELGVAPAAETEKTYQRLLG